jgi:DNA-binding SARP family transcriptional activator
MAVGEAVRYEILGPLRIVRGGRDVPLDRADLKALLAVLLIQPNEAVPLPRIVEAVWPALPLMSDHATAVSELFGALDRIIDPAEPDPAGGRLVALNNGSYMVCVEPDDLDTTVFSDLYEQARRLRAANRPGEAAAALRQALGMWRDEPLTGLQGAAFAAARARIGEARCAVLEELAEIELDQNAAELLRKVTRWVTEYPLSERLRAVKMVALDRAGRRPEAFGTFDEFQRIALAVRGYGASGRLLALRWQIEQGTSATQEPITASQEPQGPITPTQPVPAAPKARTNWKVVVLKLLGAAVPLVTFGLASPILFGVLGIKRRSVVLFGSAIGYATAFFLAVAWDTGGAFLLLGGMVAASIQAALVIGKG